jgi:hypothetical protein
MTTKLNTLNVRRVDLLEQLEERYVVMTKEKEKYDVLLEKFHKDSDEYKKRVEQWQDKIKEYLLERFNEMTPEVEYRGRDAYARYWQTYRMERWTASLDISYTVEDLVKIVGEPPEEPQGPELPYFLREKWSKGYNSVSPSLYQSVYQAIQVLHLSDDEHVPASMYQMALEVL